MAVLKGRARAIEGQTQYILGQGENEEVNLLAVENCISTDPWLADQEMRFIAELSTSQKPSYHGQLSLAKEESKRVTNDQYIDMVHIIRDKLILPSTTKTLISKHTKDGADHIHFSFLLVDPATGKLYPTWKNYYKHDEARMEIEDKYNLIRTPLRSLNKQDRRSAALEAWDTTTTGEELVRAMRQKNLVIATTRKEQRKWRLIELFSGTDKSPKNHNLVRELDGIITAQVRERLQGVKLPLDEDVMEKARIERDRWKIAQEQIRREDKRIDAQADAKRVTENTRQEEAERFMKKGKKRGLDYER